MQGLSRLFEKNKYSTVSRNCVRLINSKYLVPQLHTFDSGDESDPIVETQGSERNPCTLSFSGCFSCYSELYRTVRP